MAKGDDVRFEFRLAGLSDVEEDGAGRCCPRSEGDGLNNGVVGADNRREFRAAIEGDAVTDDVGGLGEPAVESRGEGELAAFTDDALASPDALGLALLGMLDAVAGDDDGAGL